jgi:hypothetical protein
LLRDCSGLEFFAFATELALVPAPSSTVKDPRAVGAVVLLTSAGLKIGKLSGSSESAFPLEGAMLGVAEAGQWIGDAVCADRAAELLVGDGERAAIANDALYEKIESRKPDAEELQAAKTALGCGAKLAGFAIEDFEIAARDGAGAIYAFKIRVRADNGVPYLKGNPLVRLERVGHRE